MGEQPGQLPQRSWREHPLVRRTPGQTSGEQAVSWLWALSPIFTSGLAIPFVFLVAALKKRTRGWWVATAAYTGAFALAFIGAATEGISGASIWGLTWMTGSVHALVVRRRVFEPVGVVDLSTDPALARALHAQERRELARQILAQDPRLASDLAIGRPDLGRGYDDGGLVDVNSAPASLLVRGLGLDPASADRLVVARSAASGFTSVEEMVVLAELSPSLVDRLGDRIVLSPRG